MKHLALFVLLTMTAALFCAAQYTTRPDLQPQPAVTSPAAAADTAVADTLRGEQAQAIVTVTGYEKPLRSTKETVLIRLSDDAPVLSAVVLDIEYRDMSGNALHRRSVTLPISQEAGQTRMHVFRSWDVNRVFYYHLNRPPRTTAQGTPYKIAMTVAAAILR